MLTPLYKMSEYLSASIQLNPFTGQHSTTYRVLLQGSSSVSYTYRYYTYVTAVFQVHLLLQPLQPTPDALVQYPMAGLTTTAIALGTLIVVSIVTPAATQLLMTCTVTALPDGCLETRPASAVVSIYR